MHKINYESSSLFDAELGRGWLMAIGASALSILLSACGAGGATSADEQEAESSQNLVDPANATWVAQGPAPMLNGPALTWPPTDNNPVAGAIRSVATHPTNANIVYAGTVNGGVWKTNNALAQDPSWTPLTDQIESLSIGAVAVDRTNPNTVVAATGLWSAFGTSRAKPNEGVSQGQVLVSRDAGSTWTVYVDPLFAGQKASSVMVRGSTIVVGFLDSVGLVRSTDLGAHWSRISGSGTGLPDGSVDDLAEDIQNSTRLYLTATGLGVFRSEDLGANWVNISQNDAGDQRLDDQIRNFSTAAKVSVCADGRTFVGIVSTPTHNGLTFVSYVGYTTDAGNHWTAMDPPYIEARGEPYFHFSLAADRSNSSFVYVGGVANPVRGNTGAPLGNGMQWESLVSTTPHGTWPHVDARNMIIDPNLDLLEVSDGGIFRRVRPRENTGDWFSMAGDMQDGEVYSIAYDPVARVILAGTQDNGTAYQNGPNQRPWITINPEDGGDVQVDSLSIPGNSVRYSSGQFLMSFTRSVWDANNTLVSQTSPTLLTPDGSFFQAQFLSPLAINQADPRRIAIGAADAVYESFDQGDHIVSLGSAPNAQNIAYGSPANPDILYAAAGQVYVRLSAGSPLAPATAIPDCRAKDVVMDPADYRKAYVLCDSAVSVTSDAGSTWSSVTGNLLALNPNPGVLRSVRYIAGISNQYLAVSADRGVYVSAAAAPGTWTKIGDKLPIAPVLDMQYSAAQDILVVGLLGRGAWSVTGLGGP